MAETANQSINTNIPPPFYIGYGVKEREQFFSDLGNFSPSQLEIFQTLCKIWQPEIPYAKFMNQISGAIKNVNAELDRVMAKLFQAKCGLIKIHYASGEQVRGSIVLTDPGSPRFFYYAILNELEIFFNGMGDAVPYEDYLESCGVRPPAAQELEQGKYSVIFEDARGKQDCAIYRVALPNKKALLLPAGGGMRFINFCLGKLRDSLTDTNMASGVAKIQQISMSELGRRAESKDPLVISGIAKAIQQMRHNAVETKRFQVPEMVFHCMLILSHLISCNIEEIKRKKNAEEEFARDKNALARLIEGESEPFVSEKRLAELMSTFRDKYKDKFESFRRKFMEDVLGPTEEEKMPLIVSIFNSYIHRDNFFQIFLNRLRIFQENADQFTMKTMEQILCTNNRSGNATFYSRENFDTELKALLRRSDPCLYEIFNNPKILSEAIIYNLKTKKKVRDMSAIQSELEKYFTSEAMQLKGFSVILNISLLDIFQRAFTRLAWWRQLLIKFSGKYASYQDQYARQGYKRPGAPPVQNTARRADDSAKAVSGELLPEAVSGPSAAGTMTQRRQRKGPQNIKKKNYTKRQQENAWNEFSKTVRPNK
jgi:hypothetical protein